MVLNFNMNPLYSTAAFPHLRIKVTYNNTDWAALYANLRKAHRLLGVIAKILRHMREHVKSQSMIYKAVVHTVLLYRCEI